MLRVEDVQTFLEVTRTLNYSKAADNLTCSQPAVYQRVQTLEHALGVKLFSRAGRGIALSPAGAVLLPYAESLLNHVGELEARAADLRAVSISDVIVAANPTIGAVLPPYIAHFNQLQPHVQVSLRIFFVQDRWDALQKVADHDVDIAVGHLAHMSLPTKSASPHLRLIPWFNLPVCMVATSGHYVRLSNQLAHGDEVKLYISSNFWIDRIRFVDESAAHRAKILPINLGTIEACKQACHAGLGACLTAEPLVRAELDAGIMRVLEPPVPIPLPTIHLITRNTVPEPVESLVRFLQDAAPSVSMKAAATQYDSA